MVYKICFRSNKQKVDRKTLGIKEETHKSYTCTIPEDYLNRIGITKEERLVDVFMDGDKIVITKVKED